MYLFNDNWEVNITETDYNPCSMDNAVRPDTYIVICEGYSKKLLLKITDTLHINEKQIVLSVSFYTPHDDFVFLNDDKLIMFLNDTVCEFDIQTGKVRKKKLDISGTLFSVHRYQDDFILYAEMDIIRMTSNLDVLWDFGAKDIFVRYQGNEPAFVMYDDRIRLCDFSDNYYEIDYNGKLMGD